MIEHESSSQLFFEIRNSQIQIECIFAKNKSSLTRFADETLQKGSAKTTEAPVIELCKKSLLDQDWLCMKNGELQIVNKLALDNEEIACHFDTQHFSLSKKRKKRNSLIEDNFFLASKV
jgi:hypothetical protein